MKDRPGHEIVPQLVTGVDRSLRHASVPRSVVFPAQLRSLCVTECPGVAEAEVTLASTPTMFLRPPSLAVRKCRSITPGWHSNASYASQARQALFQA